MAKIRLAIVWVAILSGVLGCDRDSSTDSIPVAEVTAPTVSDTAAPRPVFESSPRKLTPYERFSFVITVAGEHFVVLKTSAEVEWAKEDVILLSSEVAQASLKPEAITEEWDGLRGTEFHLYADSEHPCRARVTGIVGLSRDGGPASAMVDYQTPGAEEVWRYGSRLVAARVEPLGVTECDEPFWARSPDAPVPLFWSQVEISKEERKGVLAAFRETDVYAEARAQFEGQAQWLPPQLDGQLPEDFWVYTKFIAFAHPGDGRRLIHLNTNGSWFDEGCGYDASGDTWSLYSASDGVVSIQNEGSGQRYRNFTPVAVVELDQEGAPLFISNAWARMSGEGQRNSDRQVMIPEDGRYGFTDHTTISIEGDP